MAMYALRIKPLLAWLIKKSKENTNTLPSRQDVFPGDLSKLGNLE